MVSLDVGCGKNKKAMLGIDYSRNSDADIIADTCHLPFRNQTFQTVYCYNVIEHVGNPLLLLKEIERVLETNGQLDLTTDNAQYFSWTVLKQGGVDHTTVSKDHVGLYLPKHVK